MLATPRQPLTKTNRIKATGARISIIGHIARHELLKLLSETEQANGFANRFLGFRVRRSKVIADPVPVPADVLKALIDRMRTTVEFGKAAVGQRYCIVYRVERREVIVVIVAVGRRKASDKNDIYELAKKLLRLGLLR